MAAAAASPAAPAGQTAPSAPAAAAAAPVAVAEAPKQRRAVDAYPLSHVNVPKEVQQLYGEMVAVRRHLHRHPELSLLEFETAKFVAAKLREIGHIEVFEKCGQTGVVGVLRGGKATANSPCVALRADMDALPMQEVSSALNGEYKSQTPGVSHACGHDGHVSTLLGAARVLVGMRDQLAGVVKFVFQPGEEGKAGAKLMIADGVLDGGGRFGPRVDHIFGLHYCNLLDFPVGAVGVRAGAFMASADSFKITVRGKGGHGGMPHTTSDAIVATAYLVTQLQTIVSRNVHPIDSAVVSVGTIRGGHNDNIIADTVVLTGTIRAYSESTRTLVIARVRDFVDALCKAFAVTAAIEFVAGYPPTINASSPHVAAVVGAASKVVGHSHVVDVNPVMGAEDFSFFLQQRGGCFFFVASNPYEAVSGHTLPYDFKTPAAAAAASGAPTPTNVSAVLPLVSGQYDVVSNHRPDFDLDERCMLVGAAIFVQLITDLLISPKPDAVTVTGAGVTGAPAATAATAAAAATAAGAAAAAGGGGGCGACSCAKPASG